MKLRKQIILAMITGLLHVLEQWFLDFDLAFAEVEKMFVRLQGLFDNPDKAVLFLVTIFLLLWMTTLYFAFKGGRWKAIPAFVFGVMYISEIRHVLLSIRSLSYHSGSLTAILMMLVVILFLREGLRNLMGK